MLIIAFIIVGEVNKDPVGVPATATSTSTSEAEAAAEREAAFQAQRQEAEEQEVAFSIKVANLPEAQQTALGVMGFTSTSSIEITNKMVTCAKVDMSETRMAEVKDGATVTAAEGVRLMSCYNANN